MQALQGGLQRQRAAHFESHYEGNKCNTRLYSRKSHSKYPFSTLSYSSEVSCPCCVQASLSLNSLKLTRPGFLINYLPVSCGDIGFLQKIPRFSIGLEIRLQSTFTAFRPLLPSENLKTILLSDLVRCDSSLRL
jgi:hypothetical protein